MNPWHKIPTQQNIVLSPAYLLHVHLGAHWRGVVALHLHVFSSQNLPDLTLPMTTRQQIAKDDALFRTLKLPQEKLSATRRTLAKEANIDDNTVNICFKTRVEKL